MRPGQNQSLKNWPVSGQSWARIVFPPVLTLGLLVLFWDRFAEIDLSVTRTAFTQISTAQWIAALGLTCVSYWALGRYDIVCHRLLKTGISRDRAGPAGAAALAVSQTLGLGLITGAIARWRLLPDLRPAQALKVSSFFAISFMCIWAVLALAVLGFTDIGMLRHDVARPLAQIAVVSVVVGCVCLVLVPSGWPRQVRKWLRKRDIALRSLAALSIFATLDILAAAGVLVVLIGTPLPVAQLVAVFILALGVGLVSSTPSGLGAFELTMISLLPQADPGLLLSSIVGYRVVYFSLPALVGLTALAWPSLLHRNKRAPATGWAQAQSEAPVHDTLDDLLKQAPFAEAQLARQPGLDLLWSKELGGGAIIGATGRSLVMLRDPFPKHEASAVFDGFTHFANKRDLVPCYYKCNARSAVALRSRGYHVLPIAHEAWVSPASYSVATRARRQLRRKLRQAEKAGVQFELARQDRLPLRDMARINAAWAEAHGGERGFSMGRYFPELLPNQRVYLAWQGQDLVGFASFHQVDAEWSLDLLRPMPGSLDGVAHGLIDCAIRDAADHAIPRLSLAAAPKTASAERDLGESPLAHLRRRLAQRSGGSGLARFKSMFDPNWDPLYLAAPSKRALVQAGLELCRAIGRPLPADTPRPKG